LVHEQFLPVYEKNWLVGIDSMLVLLLKAFHVGIENELHIISSFKAIDKKFSGCFFDQEIARGLCHFRFDGFEFVTAHTFASLQVIEVDVLLRNFTETIYICRLKEAIEYSRYHSHLISQFVIAHRLHGVA